MSRVSNVNKYAALFVFLFIPACTDFIEIDTKASHEVSHLQTSAGDGKFVLTWLDPAYSDFDHVEISWSPGDSSIKIVASNIQTYTAIGLNNDKHYVFTVKTVDLNGNASSGITIEIELKLLWKESFLERTSLLNGRERNDPVIFIEPDSSHSYKMIVINASEKPVYKWDFYRSDDADGPWNLYHQMVVDQNETPQWGRKDSSGKFYIFTSESDLYTDLYIGDSLTSLTQWGRVLEESDSGGFYDPENDIWHIFFEQDKADGDPCGWKLGHKTSKNGRDNWVDQGTAIDLDDSGKNWHTGDPDIIKIDNTYFMFLDHTDPDSGHHPYYWISVYKSADLFEWEEQGIVTYHYGGDACVRFIPEKNKFYMWTEYWNPPLLGVGYLTSVGPDKKRSYKIDPKWNRMDIYISN